MAQDSTGRTSKGRVLVVDDSPDICEIVSVILESSGKFETLSAGDGVEALNILSGETIDVILMDERMPNMSGHECFLQLRERAIYIPVIFFTGLVDPKNMTRDLALGAFDYITKPPVAEELLILVEDAYSARLRMKSLEKKQNPA